MSMRLGHLRGASEMFEYLGLSFPTKPAASRDMKG
jgi:hypothetical protein